MGSGCGDSEACRKLSSTRPPIFKSISPEASHCPRSFESVRYDQTRSMGPGNKRCRLTLPGAVTSAYSFMSGSFVGDRSSWELDSHDITACRGGAATLRAHRAA